MSYTVSLSCTSCGRKLAEIPADERPRNQIESIRLAMGRLLRMAKDEGWEIEPNDAYCQNCRSNEAG